MSSGLKALRASGRLRRRTRTASRWSRIRTGSSAMVLLGSASWEAGATTRGSARPPGVGGDRRPLVASGRHAPRHRLRAGGRRAARRLEPPGEGERRPLRRAVGPVPHRRRRVRGRAGAHRAARARRVAVARAVRAASTSATSSCLARAYGAGDFSLAYPLARGGGAMVAAIGGVAFLDDQLTGARLRRDPRDHRWARVLRAAGHVVGLDPVGAAGRGADRLLHARRRGRRPAHRGHRLRARHLRRRPSITVSAWGLATGHLANLRRSLADLVAARTSPAAWRRPRPTGWCSSPCGGRRSATSPRSASRRWCWPPSPAGGYLAEGFGRARLASATVVVTGLVLLVVAR